MANSGNTIYGVSVIRLGQVWFTCQELGQSNPSVVWDTKCSPERVALQMPGSTLPECAGASAVTAGILTQERESLCACLSGTSSRPCDGGCLSRHLQEAAGCSPRQWPHRSLPVSSRPRPGPRCRWARTSWVIECRRLWVALSGLREWPWVGPEGGLRETFVEFRTLPELFLYVRPVCESDLWVPIPDSVVCECVWAIARAGSNGECQGN